MIQPPTTTVTKLATAVALALALTSPRSAGASDLAKRFQAHIDFLASDELQGRGVGSPGIERAAEYIADRFRDIGLSPAGERGTFFQTFELTLHRTLTGHSQLAFAGGADELRVGIDFIPFGFSSGERFSGDVVFCGYAIESGERGRDDFVHVDLTGKAALLLRGEPPSWADEGGNTTQHAMLRNKVYNAKDRGAVAVFIVNQTPSEGEKDALTDFVAKGADAYGVPAFHVTRALADALLKRGGLDPLAALQKRADDGAYVSRALAKVHAKGKADFKTNTAPTRNVVAVLKADGPFADEFVVLGAHYDHLGVQKPMMRRFKAGKLVPDDSGPQIHNGADDNASGTSGLIEIARMLAAGPPPKRSVLFVAFTAEETGLHGSKYFVEHPPKPLSNMVAMLNMDMIGRMPPGKDMVQVFGVDCGESFRQILEPLAKAAGLTPAPSPDTGGRSDHASFIRHDIPSMHFFTGQHPDYHKPGDDADKINAEGGARVTKLVHDVALALCTRDDRPTFQAIKAKGTIEPGDTPTYRVVMGLAPGYGDDGKPGMAVEAVSPDGPADLAGMKTGDRIIRIGGKKVANIYDYMAATRKNKAGDKVAVVVLRGGKEVSLEITLAPAR